MPKKLEDCVQKVKAQAKKDHPKWSDEKVSDYAWSVCQKSVGGKHKENKENLRIIKFAEISREGLTSPELKDDFLIFPATLATVSTSRNHVTYTREALAPLISKYQSDYKGGYNGAPIFIDHNLTTVENIVGRVENVTFIDDRLRADLYLEADSKVTRKVRRGLIRHVSFHNAVENVKCSICSKEVGTECRDHEVGMEYEGKKCTMIPQDLGAVEVSLVAYAGITDAKIGEGINAWELLEGFDQRFDIKTSDNTSGDLITIIDTDNSENDDSSNETFISKDNVESIKETINDNNMDKRQSTMTDEKILELQEQNATMKLQIESLGKQLEEKDINIAEKQKIIEDYKANEEARLIANKNELVESIFGEDGTKEITEQYMKFSLDALTEMAKIVKTQPETSEASPEPKAVASDVGSIKPNPVSGKVIDFINRNL